MMMRPDNTPLIYCAADTNDAARASIIADAMMQAGCGLKIGLEFFNAHGPAGVRALTEKRPGLSTFLDLKFHDIPNTVAGAVRAITPLSPAYINVHATGGLNMMRAARQAAQEAAIQHKVTAPRILGVTMLTSLDEWTLATIGFETGIKARVVQLARLAREAGLDGVVCSAHEIAAIRQACGDKFILMVPGIRPAGSDAGDQKRVMTPKEAADAGATHLVIGRPITEAPDPAQAAAAIMAGLG